MSPIAFRLDAMTVLVSEASLWMILKYFITSLIVYYVIIVGGWESVAYDGLMKTLISGFVTILLSFTPPKTISVIEVI